MVDAELEKKAQNLLMQESPLEWRPELMVLVEYPNGGHGFAHEKQLYRIELEDSAKE